MPDGNIFHVIYLTIITTRLYPSQVKKVVETVLQELLTIETKFDEKEIQELSKNIADTIRKRLSGNLYT